MKKVFVFVLAIFMSVGIASAQKGGGDASDKTFGAGLVAGIPTGVNAKLNLNQKFDLEFMAGLAPNFGGNYAAYNSNYRRRKDYAYDYYSVRRMGTFLVNFHYHQKIKALPELMWYAGGGVQMNVVNYYTNDYWHNGTHYRNDNVTEVNLGLNVNGGAEYFFKGIGVPLSAFAQVGVYVEMANDPGLAFVVPNAGVRYWFK